MVWGGAFDAPFRWTKTYFTAIIHRFGTLTPRSESGAVPYVSFGVLLIIFLNATPPLNRSTSWDLSTGFTIC